MKLQLQRIAATAGFSSTSIAAGAPAGATPGRAPQGRGPALAWGVAALALAAAVAFAAFALPRAMAPPPAYHFRPRTRPAGATESFWPRISPDGSSLLFVALDSTNVPCAFVVRLDDDAPRPVTGAQGFAARVYWSPDGREIAYVAGEKLVRIPATGGSPTTICPAPHGSDLSWGRKGVILLDGNTTDSLRAVPAGGGDLAPATRVDRASHETGSAWPSFLPDGERFLFVGINGDAPGGDIRLGRLGSLDSKQLGHTDGRVEYAPGDWVLYVRGAALVAQKLDVGAGKLVGEPITLADDLRLGTSLGHFSVSATGVLAIAHGASGSNDEIRLATRTGAIAPEGLTHGWVYNPSFSPDGQRLLYERASAGADESGEAYVLDLARRTDTRLTFTEGKLICSDWSPDGRRVAYTARTSRGGTRLVLAAADGLGAQDSVAIPRSCYVSQWSPDGARVIVYTNDGVALTCAPGGPDPSPRPVGDAGLRMYHPEASPDGRWLAGVVALAEGNAEVFVYSLTGAPGRWQISTGHGTMAVWTKSGREIVYEGANRMLMAVDIDTRDGGFHPGTPHALFRLPYASFGREGRSWGTHGAGERFALVAPGRAAENDGYIDVMTRFDTLVHRH